MGLIRKLNHDHCLTIRVDHYRASESNIMDSRWLTLSLESGIVSSLLLSCLPSILGWQLEFMITAIILSIYMDHLSQFSSTVLVTEEHRSFKLQNSFISCAGHSVRTSGTIITAILSIDMDHPNQFLVTVTDGHHDSSLEMSGSSVTSCAARTCIQDSGRWAAPETKFLMEYIDPESLYLGNRMVYHFGAAQEWQI